MTVTHPVPHRGFAAEAAASGIVLGQAIELLQVGVEPEEEPGHLPPKRPVPRAHPRRLIDLFGEVHDPRLKPEGLVETVDDLAEMMVHGRLLAWRVLVMGMDELGRRATLQEPCAIVALHDERLRIPEPALDPAGAKRGASLLVSARSGLLPPVAVSITRTCALGLGYRAASGHRACLGSSALS